MLNFVVRPSYILICSWSVFSTWEFPMALSVSQASDLYPYYEKAYKWVKENKPRLEHLLSQYQEWQKIPSDELPDELPTEYYEIVEELHRDLYKPEPIYLRFGNYPILIAEKC